jgi:chitobiase
MNKIFIALMLGSLALVSSCKKEDLGAKPTDLDQASITAEPGPGSILLKWSIPQGADYRYVRVSYTNPATNKPAMRLASIHSDTLRVDGLLARYGTIEFKICPIGEKGAEGTTHTISAQAKPLPKITKITDAAAEKLVLAAGADDLFVSDPESSEGPKAHLIDNNNGTFYHESWSGTKRPMPHYIVMKLPRTVKAFHFFMKARNNGNRSNPVEMGIYTSDSFDGNFDLEANKAALVKSLTGLPDAQAADYTSPVMLADKAYTYVWFQIKKVYNNQAYAALAELHVFAHKTEVYDPETGETTNE